MVKDVNGQILPVGVDLKRRWQSILSRDFRGRVDDFLFSNYSYPFCVLLIEFHFTFQFLVKYYYFMYIIIVF